ncbi:MAG: hypothetical protein ABJE66_04375 [Deltaproteobacteria bacterium]
MSYDALVAGFTRYYRFQHLAQIVAWDQAAMMPAGGNDARGAAMAELAVLMHELLTKLDFANVDDTPSVREMRRQWRAATLLPAARTGSCRSAPSCFPAPTRARHPLVIRN